MQYKHMYLLTKNHKLFTMPNKLQNYSQYAKQITKLIKLNFLTAEIGIQKKNKLLLVQLVLCSSYKFQFSQWNIY